MFSFGKNFDRKTTFERWETILIVKIRILASNIIIRESWGE